MQKCYDYQIFFFKFVTLNTKKTDYSITIKSLILPKNNSY